MSGGRLGTAVPIYEFHCQSCDRDFEELVRSDQAIRSIACPHCSASNVERRLSVFAARGKGESASAESMPGACGRCGDPNGPCGM